MKRTLKGILRRGDHESTCEVLLEVAGTKGASYYVGAELVDASVSPPLGDGNYEFHYPGEATAEVTRRDGEWSKVPASAKEPL